MDLELANRYSAVHLCVEHIEPYDTLPDRRGNRQLCPECPGAATQPRWEHTDFNAWIGICECCTAAFVPSGSRWSPFFCSGCKAAMEVAEAAGYPPLDIPVGRHTLMNGLGLRVSDVDNPDAVAAFFRESESLQDRIARLREWRKERLRLFVADRETDPQLGAVLEVAGRSWNSREAFRALWRWWVDIDVEEDR